VTITTDSDGTVLSVTPPRGVVGTGAIRVNRLSKTLDITVEELNAETGYGYGPSGAAITVSFDSRSLDHGDFVAEATVDLAAEDDASSSHSFTVVLPSGSNPPGQSGSPSGNGPVP
jgi:hypothetical protein